jgi:hypothetical protein
MNSLTADFGLFHLDIRFPGRENDDKKTTLNKVSQVALNAIATAFVAATNIPRMSYSFVTTLISFTTLATTTAFVFVLKTAQTVIAVNLMVVGFLLPAAAISSIFLGTSS